ncbi:hypothetical protein AURDEDRAFT_41321, partial [Auricularia subglabra TFB-10046 SS5]
IRFIINVQHDCHTLTCGVSHVAEDTVPVMQEHIQTDLRLPTIKHNSDEHFLINMHAIHNAARLRQVLPVALVKP